MVKLPRPIDVARALGRRAAPYAPPLAGSLAVGGLAVRGILEKAGRPALPLDDSFIHLVFARSFAEGRPFVFGLADGPSTGATSFLWPLLLAPFHACGLHGLSLVWAAWILGTLFHAATALEIYRLAEPLTGRAVAAAAGAASLVFGAFAWFAWSGMETVPFAWAMTRAVRVAAGWAETPAHERDLRGALGVAFAGALPPLFRPEGAAISGLVVLALLVWPATGFARRGAALGRLPALGAVLGAAVPPLVNLALTGHARSTTAMVKWAVGNPYHAGERLTAYVSGTARMLVDDLLGGGVYTTIFLPPHTNVAIAAGLVGAVGAGLERRRIARACAVLAFALATLVTATFLTILWNRVRYIYSFAPAWIVLVACAAAQVDSLARRLRPELRVGPVLMGMAAGLLASKLSWALDDLATSARAIDKQQVTMGQWASHALPEDARIGLNDTGAIAYFSQRRTFDVVGLTTESEARYWVAGAGARYEHYERLPREALPTHFIVYREWIGVPTILGEELHHATVTDQSILGGVTKSAHVAVWDALGRGAQPGAILRGGRVVGDVDVADLESEATHAYELGRTATDTDCVAISHWGDDDDDAVVVDGGRRRRTLDRFLVDLPTERPLRLIGRFDAPTDVTLTVRVGGADVGTIELTASAWEERELALPATAGGARRPIEIAAPAGATFGALHYWFVED